MMEYSLVRVADVLKVPLAGENPIIDAVSIDTRTLTPGCLFVAIEGDTFDGHDFLTEAKRKGAVAAIVNRKVDVDFPQLIVKDTTLALGALAADCRDRIKIPLIAVTGSTGKTTTKNLIGSILQVVLGKDKALASAGGLNNHWGLPLTLTRLTSKHRAAVVEMGMNRFSELKYLSDIARPDVTVITNVAPCHLKSVGSLEGVAKAKAEVFSGLTLQGTAVLNRDEPFFDYWCGQLEGHRVMSFGDDERADVRATIKTIMPQTTFILHTPHGDIDVELKLVGAHNVKNALAATAAALVLDVELSAIKEGLEAVTAMPGRLRVLELPGHVTLFDDAYNANPLSVRAGIDILKLSEGKKILVLGDMKELGAEEERFHAEIGAYAKASGIDKLFTYGELTQKTADTFGEGAMHFSSRANLLNELEPELNQGTSVLVKGSLSMNMQDIVVNLLNEVKVESTLF